MTWLKETAALILMVVAIASFIMLAHGFSDPVGIEHIGRE